MRALSKLPVLSLGRQDIARLRYINGIRCYSAAETNQKAKGIEEEEFRKLDIIKKDTRVMRRRREAPEVPPPRY